MSVIIIFSKYQLIDWVYALIFLFLFLIVNFGFYNFWSSTSLQFGFFSKPMVFITRLFIHNLPDFFNVNTYKIYSEFLIILLWLSFDSKKYRSSFLASSVSHRSLSSALLTLQIFRSFLLRQISTLFCYNLIIYKKLHQLFHILCWLYVL